MGFSDENKIRINEAKKKFYTAAMNLYNFYEREASEEGKELSSRPSTKIINIEDVCKEKGLRVWNQEDDFNCEEFISKRMKGEGFTREEYKNICEYYSIEYNNDNFADIFYRLRATRGKDRNIFKKIFKEIIQDLFMKDDEIEAINEKNFYKREFFGKESRVISELKTSIYNLIVESEKLFMDAENF